MHENLMDMNHQFLHRKQMGQMKPRFMGQRLGEDWIEAKYTFSRTSGKQPLGEAAIFGPRRGAGGAATAEKDVMTIRTEYPYQTLRIHIGGNLPVMDLWIVYVPLDARQRTNRTFGLLSIKRPRIPGLLEAGWPLLVIFTERILKEDREIVELEQAAHDAQGADWNQEVFPVIRNLRTLLRSCGGPTLRIT
jgi:renierapurpurin 18,18'-hydroxylase